MPPSQRFLASTIRGYVCKSCLAKLRAPLRLRQPPQWLSRPITNGNSPSRKTGAADGATSKKTTIRYFDETEDGVREELNLDEFGLDMNQDLEGSAEDEPYLQLFREKLSELSEQSGMDEELLGQYYDLEKLMDDCIEEADAQEEEEELSMENVVGEDLASYDEDLESLMDSIVSDDDLDNLSEKEKLRLRKQLLRHYKMDEDAPPPLSDESDYIEPDSETAQEVASQEEPLEAEGHVEMPSPPSVIQVMRVPSQPVTSNPRVKALNNALRSLSSKRPGNKISSKAVWKAYLSCRISVDTLNQIPPQTWTTLWNMFSGKITSSDKAISPESYSRLKSIGDDMERIGIKLEYEWCLLHVEAVFVQGELARALNMWQAAKPDQVEDVGHLSTYWKLGVMMYCRADQADSALQAAEVLLMEPKDPLEFRVLLPIIKAYLDSKQKSSVQRAWALYVRFRVNMGSRLTMGDYDSVINVLLEANQRDLALAVFRDMMLTGSDSGFREDSTAQYRSEVSQSSLDSLDINDEELSWKNSQNLAKLPTRFNNRFFFGSWIKKLIGEGQLDAANKVFDLMQERRIKPDAKHMNGLIGAWFREGTEKSRIKAEEMAWMMIQARINFTKRRKSMANLDPQLHAIPQWNPADPRPVLHNPLIPLANIETFCVLLQQYRQRQRSEQALQLFDSLIEAEIKPNTAYMNELMLTDSRAHQSGWAWDTYLSLTQSQQVRPDFQTYEILWALMKRSVDPAIAVVPQRKRQTFPTCRALFADMMKQVPNITKTEIISRELYELVLLSFSVAQDATGSAVAMNSMAKRLDIYPSQATTLTIVHQLARIGLYNEMGLKPRRLNPSKPNSREKIQAVTAILQKFKDERVSALLGQGIVYEELSGSAKGHENLMVLLDLLRHATRIRLQGEDRGKYTPGMASANAAEQMGVPEDTPWTSYTIIQ